MSSKNKHNTLKINILNIFILSFISINVFGQDLNPDQNPLSVKWRQLNVSGFKIIYPTELEKEAQRMANTIPKIYPAVGRSLNQRNTLLPIVLQNRGTLANGFVQLAPKKSEFYTTPPQQFDSQDWLNSLAVHELRHVAQFDKLTGGRTKPFPEEIYFAYFGIALPTWFFEGDAVSIETALTNAGRGRQPSWIMPFRTALLNEKNFSYSKAYFGSNKDQTPGYYQLGYLLISQLRKEFGKNIIDSILSDIHRRPLRFYPFARSLKKFTGKNTNTWYKHSVEQLKKEWKHQDSLNISENYEPFNKPATLATSYFLPTPFGDDQVLSLKHSKATTPAFVLIDHNKHEKKLFGIAYQEQPWFSYASSILAWDEIRFDPRYKQRSYSVICIYDFNTRKKRQLTFKTRLFAPSLSADGKKLIAVQISLANKINLVEIDRQSGKIIKTYPNPEGDILQTPALNADGSSLSWISVNEKGKALWLKDKNDIDHKIIAEISQQLSKSAFIGDKIAFNGHLNGVDNIFEVDPPTKEIMALSAAKYGAFNASPSANGKEIWFNNYNLMGYDITRAPVIKQKIQENDFVYFGKATQEQEHPGNVFNEIPQQVFDSKPYRPLGNLFNFHSLSPTIDDSDRPGLQLKSADLLNTFNFYTGIAYDNDLRKMIYNAGFSYKAIYPILNTNYENRPRTAFYKEKNNIKQANWRENYLSIKASLPLSINSYQHNYGLLAEIGTSYTQRSLNKADDKIINRTINFPMNYRLAFNHSLRQAERDLAPKFAQYFAFRYFDQPFDDRYKGKLFAFESSLYFPGIAKNHSFSIGFNYQKASGVLNANTEITTVYGYAQIKAKSELQNTLLLNYRFPIAFPDAEIGSLAYLRNLRGGFFSHYENIGKETNLTAPKTFGIELRSSLNLLRYQPIVDLGARIVFVNKIYHQNPILEFIFNYSF